jgi:hypothetical protein
MLIIGDNSISITINNKESNTTINDANISFQITRAIEDSYDINLNEFKFVNGSYNSIAKIDMIGNWNIIGKIVIGEDIGYLYIKTNTGEIPLFKRAF